MKSEYLVCALENVLAKKDVQTESQKAAQKIKEAQRLIEHSKRSLALAPKSGSEVDLDQLQEKMDELSELLEESLKIEEQFLSSEKYNILDF